MKTHFIESAILFFVIICLSSCVTTHTYTASFSQIAQTKSSTSSMAHYDVATNSYCYDDENVHAQYIFWSAGGVTTCIIENKTNEILYIDLDKCFFVKDNVSYTYYQPVSIIDDKTVKMPVQCKTIAPKSKYTLSGLSIGFERYTDCALDIKPSANNPASVSFDESNSPAQYRCVITYRVGDDGKSKSFSNDFYISSITNYRLSDIYRDVKKEIEYAPCENVESSLEPNTIYKYHKYIYAPNTGFYVKYNKTVTE